MTVCKICNTENDNNALLCKYCGSYVKYGKSHKISLWGFLCLIISVIFSNSPAILLLFPALILLVIGLVYSFIDIKKINKIRKDNNIDMKQLLFKKDTGNTLIFVDIETTGLSVYRDEIIELSAIKVENNEVIDTFSYLIKPFGKVSPKATAVNGITDDMLKNEKRINEILPEFVNFCGNYPLIAHNANFDLSFICRDCKRYGLDFKPKFIDTLAIAQNTLQLNNYKLETIGKHFKILENKQEHRGLSDCYLVFECYKALNTQYRPRKYYLNYNVDMDKVNIKVDESNIIPNQTVNKNSVLNDKYCVVTGDFAKFDRMGILQQIANNGGICQKNITKQTNYLICGSDAGETKLTRAKEKIAKGQDLQIIPESEFYSIIQECGEPEND